MYKNTRKLFSIIALFSLFVVHNSFSDNIFDAIDRGDLEEVELFIKKNKKIIEDGENIVNESDSNSFAIGETLLNAACYKGDLDIVKAIIKSFPKDILRRIVNEVGVDGETPLTCACWANKFDIVKFLIGKGAKTTINTANDFWQSPLYFACSNKNFDMIKYLICNNASIDQFCLDISQDSSVVSKYLEVVKEEVGGVMYRGKFHESIEAHNGFNRRLNGLFVKEYREYLFEDVFG